MPAEALSGLNHSKLSGIRVMGNKHPIKRRFRAKKGGNWLEIAIIATLSTLSVGYIIALLVLGIAEKAPS